MLVAAYCRVSTESEDQANSFESQCRFFREYITNHPDWTLSDLYADEGITGTSIRKRREFQRMLADAHNGKFSLLITKEVSRFSRNILDTIAYTRELKSLGIGVLFLTDGIHTLEPDAELRLSIMASIAQEESRKTSCRVVWGQTRQMEKGIVFGRSMLGYNVNHGCLSIEPEGAEIVRLIFHMYAISQIGAGSIARYLESSGIKTSRGNSEWSAGTVTKILKNEKYVGDLVQKKTYTADFLTHQKKTNRGEISKIIIKDHHTPIIDRETWILAQERLQRNNRHEVTKRGHSDMFGFSGKIRCGECGAAFVSRVRKSNKSTMRQWRCGTACREGTAQHCITSETRWGCDVGKLLNDANAFEMLLTALRSLQIDFSAIISNVTALALNVLRAENNCHTESNSIRKEISQVEEKMTKMMDCYFNDEIIKEEMQMMRERYTRDLIHLHCKLEHTEKIETDEKHCTANYQNIHEVLSGILSGEIHSDAFCKTILDQITVFKDKHVELTLVQLPHTFFFSEGLRQTENKD